MAAGAHLIDRGKIRDAAQMRDAPRMNDRRADVVDQLLADQILAVPDRVEDLADGEWSRRVLPDEPERLLVLGGCGVLEPEQAIGLEILPQPRGLDRRHAVMAVVQQMVIVAVRVAHLAE